MASCPYTMNRGKCRLSNPHTTHVSWRNGGRNHPATQKVEWQTPESDCFKQPFRPVCACGKPGFYNVGKTFFCKNPACEVVA